jgi:ABC-type oligopeptide transport system, ATPase component
MVRFLSDRIGVLHLGYLLETGTPDEIFEVPLHPYTRSLLSAIPRMNPVMPSDGNAVYDMREAGIDYLCL